MPRAPRRKKRIFFYPQTVYFSVMKDKPVASTDTYRIMEGPSDVSPAAYIVGPSDLWVLNRDPLGLGDGNYLTLISCHPRFSAAQRIIVFGELVA